MADIIKFSKKKKFKKTDGLIFERDKFPEAPLIASFFVPYTFLLEYPFYGEFMNLTSDNKNNSIDNFYYMMTEVSPINMDKYLVELKFYSFENSCGIEISEFNWREKFFFFLKRLFNRSSRKKKFLCADFYDKRSNLS